MKQLEFFHVSACLRFQGSGERAQAVLTGELEDVPCGLIISSIGYKSTLIDPSVPFDSHKAIVPNINGRVQQVAGIQKIYKKKLSRNKCSEAMFHFRFIL